MVSVCPGVMANRCAGESGGSVPPGSARAQGLARPIAHVPIKKTVQDTGGRRRRMPSRCTMLILRELCLYQPMPISRTIVHEHGRAAT